MKRVHALLVILTMLAVGALAANATTVRNYGTAAFTSIYVGSNGHGLTNSGYGCTDASDSVAGPWTALSPNGQGVSGSSTAFTIQGAAVGDLCIGALGTTASASNQSLTLTQRCVVTAANTGRWYISTPETTARGTITPKTGKRCATTFTPL